MPKRLLVVLLVAALSLVVVAGQAVAAEPAKPDTVVLSVTGTGRVAVAPDTAAVTLGVTTTAATAREAQQENGRLVADVIKAIVDMGVPRENIQTVEFSVWPVFEEPVKEAEPPKISAYRVNNNIRIVVDDPAKVGAVLDAGFAAGANQSYGIQFFKKNDGVERAGALQDAVKDARARAKAVADALGARIVGVAAVRVENVYSPVLMRSAAYEGMGGPVPVEPGQVEITASVSIDYKLAF
ncbi:MAG: SIMPL domain-containing protein [Desulfotomaculales bacterium]